MNPMDKGNCAMDLWPRLFKCLEDFIAGWAAQTFNILQSG